MSDTKGLSIQRRELLQSAGALVVSALAPAGVLAQAQAQATSAATGKPPLAPEELDSWAAILPDGRAAAKASVRQYRKLKRRSSYDPSIK